MSKIEIDFKIKPDDVIYDTSKRPRQLYLVL